MYRSEKGRLAVKIPAVLRHRSHRCYAGARLPPKKKKKKKKVVERKEELQRSATARSITRARTRETRYADQIGEDEGETRKKKRIKEEVGGGGKEKIETTRRRGHDVVEKKETSERASERAEKKLCERKKTRDHGAPPQVHEQHGR